MPRRTRTSRLDSRLDALEAENDERIYVVSVGGDEERSGWFTPEEYEQQYGERPDSAFTVTINGGTDP